MLSNVNNTGLIGYRLYAVAEDGDKSIEITDEGLVIGKNLNDDPEFVTLNSDGITRDGVTTNWADIDGGGDISVIEEEIEDINGKLTAVGSAPDSTTLKVNKKIVLDNGTNNGSIDINNGNVLVNSSGNIVLAPTGDVLINKNKIRLGTDAGSTSQGTNCVAIGNGAGQTNQGSNSIAIGYRAGYSSQVANSIVLNASGSALNASAGGFYVNPIRNPSVSYPYRILGYDSTNKEIIYGPSITKTVFSPSLTSSDGTMTIEPTYSNWSGRMFTVDDYKYIQGMIVLSNKGNTPNTLRIKLSGWTTIPSPVIGQLSCSPMISNCIDLRTYLDASSNLLRIQKRVDAVSDWTDLTIADITDTTTFVYNLMIIN